jgi:hypothetical protein
MAGLGWMTKEEWEAIEPYLAEADKAAHETFLASPEAQAIIGVTDTTPGYLLLQRLKELNDANAIALFRAVEMYHHEITRADINAAYLAGKAAGQKGGK